MTKLKFDEKTHKYTFGDKELTSVTTWLSEFEEPFDVSDSSKRYAKWLRREGYTHVDGKKITAREVQKHWDWIREEGTRVHRQIEAFIKGEKIFPYPNRKAAEAFDYLQEELKDMPNATISPELRIYSLDYGLAGMVDCPVFSNGDEVFIYDWKVVENMNAKKLKKYTLQLSAYAYLMECTMDVQVKGLKLVQITDEGIKAHNIEYKKDKIIELLKESGRWQKN